jgi:hypothetical protein
VIDVTDRADIAMRFVPRELFLGHGRTPLGLLEYLSVC